MHNRNFRLCRLSSAYGYGPARSVGISRSHHMKRTFVSLKCVYYFALPACFICHQQHHRSQLSSPSRCSSARVNVLENCVLCCPIHFMMMMMNIHFIETTILHFNWKTKKPPDELNYTIQFSLFSHYTGTHTRILRLSGVNGAYKFWIVDLVDRKCCDCQWMNKSEFNHFLSYCNQVQHRLSIKCGEYSVEGESLNSSKT